VPTLDEMVAEVQDVLNGFTAHTDQVTTLSTPMADSGGATVMVDDGTAISRGLIEIGSELLFIVAKDDTTNALTIPPWGRAQQGTTAAIHSSGDKVTMAPAWPVVRVRRTINEIIGDLYPHLFAIKSDESLVVDPVRWTYPLPADCRRVIDVRVKSPWLSGTWDRVGHWTLDPHADVTDFPSGQSIEILDGMTPGQQIKIVYEAAPTQLANGTDSYGTVTGLPDSSADVACLGAAAKLAVGLEMARLRITHVEQSERSTAVSGGTAANASKYLMALYQQRLADERDRLLVQYPPRIVRSR
jgi:hypothetical protein